MDLRWPESGSLLDALFSEVSASTQTGAGSLAGVTPAQLDEALLSLQRGDIEFVILEDGPAFMQAAGAGDGPYQVQVTLDGDTLHDLQGEVDAATMARVLRAYLHGDARWRDARWVPPLDH